MGDQNVDENQVFVVHDDNAIEEATDLKSRLREKGYTCQLYSETQEPGKIILYNLHASIHENQRIILLIPNDTKGMGLLTFAVVASLEKVTLKTRMPVLIAYKGRSVTKERVESLKTGLLALTPNIFVNLDEENGFDLLLDGLKSTKCLAEDLPAGNLHHGLVYSHISGFMGYVVEELKKSIPKKCEEYKNDRKLLIDRFLLVVPETCEVPSTLEMDESETICISKALKADEKVDDIFFEIDHAGKKRGYHVTIYKIKKHNEEYYICAQVPTVLTAISQLAEKHLGKIDVALEQQRFHLLYQQILDVKGWNDMVKIVNCKGCKADIARALFEAAKTLANNQLTNTSRTEKTPESTGMVFVSWCDSDSDTKVGDKITKKLDDHKIPNETPSPGKSILFQGGGNPEGWFIFVLSKDANEENAFTFNIMACLQGDVDKSKLRVMIVLNSGLEICNVPQCIKWVRFFSVTEDESYLNGILRTVSGKPVDISRALPAGDVIPGLSWAYVQNYLMKTLTDTLENRIKRYLDQKQIKYGCIQKLIIVWVKSCDTKTCLTTAANKGDPDRQVDFKGDLEETTDSFGGQIGRPFKLNVFKFTDTTKPNEKFERCFLAEYCTPMQCINMMEEEYAGMSSAAKDIQGPRFKEMLDYIMSREPIQQIFGDNKVSLIYFNVMDTSQEKLLIDMLDREIRESQKVIYRDRIEK